MTHHLKSCFSEYLLYINEQKSCSSFSKLRLSIKVICRFMKQTKERNLRKKTLFSRKNSDIFHKKVLLWIQLKGGKYTWRCQGWYTRGWRTFMDSRPFLPINQTMLDFKSIKQYFWIIFSILIYNCVKYQCDFILFYLIFCLVIVIKN